MSDNGLDGHQSINFKKLAQSEERNSNVRLAPLIASPCHSNFEMTPSPGPQPRAGTHIHVHSLAQPPIVASQNDRNAARKRHSPSPLSVG